MRKYIITLLFIMGIFTFSLFKSEQSKNRKLEIEAAVNTTTQIVTTTEANVTSTVTTTTTTTTTSSTTTTTTTQPVTTTVTTTTITTTTTLPPQTQPPTESPTEPPAEPPTEPVTEAQPIQPENETVAEASPDANNAEENSSQPDTSNMRLLGNLRITGYVATGNPTASGVMPYVGGVAMSRKYGLPFNTQIYIEGLGYYTLNDTGCAKGVVDVFCASTSDCYNLTSYANVYVVE